MGIEIERKFLIATDGWKEAQPPPHRILQGYFDSAPPLTLRARCIDDQGYLTLKAPAVEGARPEFEYPIPATDAQEMIQLFAADRLIEKHRYHVPSVEGLTWEVDIFTGALAGLEIAEIELPTVDTPFVLPAWVGAEVTDDLRYSNQALARSQSIPD